LSLVMVVSVRFGEAHRWTFPDKRDLGMPLRLRR
jgi:hypothetical protein